MADPRFTMKLVGVIALLSCLLPVPARAQVEGGSALIEQARSILKDYSQLLEQASERSPYTTAYREFNQSWGDNTVSVRISEDPCTSLLSALALDVDWENGLVWLEINAAAISMYPRHQSIIFSMLTHELWHFSCYLHYPDELRRSREDPFERVMFETDASFMEAQFIEDVMLASGRSITDFESYLVRCHQSGSLRSFTSIFMGVDSTVVDDLYLLRSDLLQGTISQDDLYQKAILLGGRIEDEFTITNEEQQAWERFSRVTSCDTFRQFIAHLVNQTEKTRTTWNEIYGDFPALKVIIDAMSLTIENDTGFAAECRTAWRTRFDIPAY
jgi:hypothetical protein